MLKALARLFGGVANEAGPATPPADESHRNVDALLAPSLAAIEAGRAEAAAALLDAVLENHPDLAEAHLLLGTLLHGQKKLEDARDAYVLASCFEPAWWRSYFRLGLLELDCGNFEQAVLALGKALALGGDDAQVHNALGAAYVHLDNAPAAVASFRKAVELQPDLAEAHSNLGYVLFRDLGEYEEGARHIDRAVELAPNDTVASCNRIMVLHLHGQTDAALALADELLARDPDFVEARHNKAVILLKKGDFERGWPDYEARKYSPRSKWTNDAPLPEWDGSSLAGRSIVIFPEQGLGDEIMFASCVPDVLARAQTCTLECNPKLEALFARSFPAAQILTTGTWRNSRALARQEPDWKVAAGSLPRFFRRTRSDFPQHQGYLRADPAKITRWKAKLAELPGHRKVGISWRGGVASTRQSLRSIPLAQWTPILAMPGIDFVSLQYSDPEGAIEALARSGAQLHEWQDAIQDYDESAALVAALDLVISVQTAIVHLTGALGRPAWALICAAPEWRYGDSGNAMPWYPSVRLIRQAILGEWAPVIETVRANLAAWTTDSAS